MLIFILINLKMLITFLTMKMAIESHVKGKWASAILLRRKSFWVSGDFLEPWWKGDRDRGKIQGTEV